MAAPRTSVAASDAFPTEEYGTSSRRAISDGDRSTLTPDDRVFLESQPQYEEGLSLFATAAPPPLPAPSRQRRLGALLLFATIAGGACLVLGLAILQWLAK